MLSHGKRTKRGQACAVSLAAYIGSPIFLEDVISLPGHSLVRQSHGATRCHTPVNADGFGMAWYGERAEPGLYRDIMPAWSDCNLKSLTATLKSHLFLAHVRASTGTATSRNNCHPFAVGKWALCIMASSAVMTAIAAMPRP